MTTLLESVAEVRNLILERSGDDGLVTDDELKKLIRIANRSVWKEGVKVNPSQWEERTNPLVYPAAGPLHFLVIGGEAATLSEALDTQFGASPVHRVTYVEVQHGSEWVPVFPSSASDRWRYDGLTTVESLPFRWYVQGMGLRFTPDPTGDLTVRTSWVPALPDPIDEEPLLYGRYVEHHDAVLFKAAGLAYAKDEAKSPWKADYDAAIAQLKMALADSEGMQTRRVHEASDY